MPSTNHTGERVELQGPWLRDTDYQETGGGETWTGYSLFFRDAVHCEQEREAEEELTLDTSCGFAAFDEEKPTVLTKRRHLQDGSEGLQRHDATLWAQLDPRPSQKARACQRLLPKDCRTLLLELFAGRQRSPPWLPRWAFLMGHPRTS